MDSEQTFPSMEDVIYHIDRKGRWQYWTMARCLILMTGISTVVYGQAIFFMGKLQYECALYDDGTDASSAFSTFINSASNTQNLTAKSIACALPNNGAQCVKWKYSSPHYDLTMVNEFDLVCGRSVWIPTFQSAVVLGQLIGLPLWGILSDRFGRLPTLRYTYIGFLFLALTMSLVRSLTWLIVLRPFLGFILSAAWNACFVICVELAMPERRNSVGIYVGTGWPLGAVITAAFALYIRNYRHLSLATLAFATICAPVIFFLEESPRWMVMHKRFDQARKLLEKHVENAKVALPEGTEFLQRIYRKRMEQDMSTHKQSQLRQMTRLLTERRLRWRTLALIVVWVGVAFVFHGIMFYGTGSLPFSPMWTLGVLSLCRIIGQPVYVWAANVFGGRNSMVYALAVTAMCMLILGFIPMRDNWFLSVVYAALYIMGFVAIDLDLSVIYIVTGELYPTVLRQSSLGFFGMAARFGNIAAPYVATLVAQYWLPLPAFVFGTVCLISTVASLALPRADDSPLPETVTEAELIEDAEQIAAPLEFGSSAKFSLRKRDSQLRRGSSPQRAAV